MVDVAGQGSFRRVVILLALVVSVVAGLLAMHTIASGMTDHGDALAPAMSMVMSADQSVIAAGDSMPAVVGVSNSQGQAHAMTEMACILALLFSAVILLAARPSAGLSLAGQPGHGRKICRPERDVQSIAPPDLDILSICRT